MKEKINTLFEKGCYKEFLSRHDMIFEQPATQWEQGIPMGNGLLGTMVWGGGDKPIRLSLDHADVWEQRNMIPDFKTFNWKTFTDYMESKDNANINDFCVPEEGKPYPTRFPVGRMELSTSGKVTSQTMRLNLYEALTEGHTVTDCGAVTWQTWVSATEPIIVLETWTEGDEMMTANPKFLSRPGDYQDSDTLESTRYKAMFSGQKGVMPKTVTQLMQQWGYPQSKEGITDDIHWWWQEIPSNGGYATAWKSISVSTGHDILLISINRDRELSDASAKAITNLDGIGSNEVDELRDKHRTWWAKFYVASFLSIPDTRLEALYYIEIYKLGSCTRPGGIHMTIQGPWSEDDNLRAYCSNDYHWNLEQQMHLWSIYASNRLDFGTPMYDLIDSWRPTLRRFCMEFFGREGEFLAHCTDPDGNPLLCNVDNFEFNGLPWVGFMYWQHYQYSMDEAFLRQRAYPLMKEALRPLIQELRIGADGYLHLPWSSSPEYHSSQETYRWVRHEMPDWSERFGPDATIDLSLIRFLCNALIQSADILEIQDNERSSWEDTLSRLTPYHMDQFGSMAVREGLALTTSHRHQSHLFPIYPLHEMTMEKDADTINSCLRVLGINGRGEWVGWAFPWVALLGAYGGRPAMARNVMLDYADRYVTESTMHYQGPQGGCDVSLYGEPSGKFGLTLEAGFGAIAAIQDLALQSAGGIVRLFENTPPSWADVALWNMRTEGAFLISAVRKDYITQFVQVRAECGGRLHLRTDFGNGPIHVECGGQDRDFVLQDNTLMVDTNRGEELLLWAGDVRPEISVEPLKGIAHEFNFYGVKRVARF